MLNLKKIKEVSRATMKSLLVAFLYSIIFFGLMFAVFHEKLDKVNSMVKLISVNTNKEIQKEVVMDEESKNLEVYPKYKSQYARLKIDSIGVDQPVYYGDTLEILKKGVGHTPGTFFPGEGGTILYMGHNTASQLSILKTIKIGAEIVVEATYGTYKYKVYDTKVIDYRDTDQVPIQRDEEILMVYTCYGQYHTTNRFVAYARPVEEEEVD